MEHEKAQDTKTASQSLDRLFHLFSVCREMDAACWSTWLEQACNGDLSLQREVEELLREDASAEGFLSRPPAWASRPLTLEITEGQRFGRYRITEFLGRGGMGEVWKAHDLELDRAVALKFVSSGLPVQQLTREAQIASALNHPGIVTVHDVLIWEGTPILVMELITGTPLPELANGLMPVEQLVSIGAQVSSALSAAHAEGIIHGDLKPDNMIWRADRFAKVLDFGLARRVAHASGGTLGGTPSYMSPEQARREVPGTASDVYSLGLVLFELATGQRPFPRQSIQEIGARSARPTKIGRPRGRLPEALEHLIICMLEPDPVERISMHEVAERLRGFQRPSGRIWRLGTIVGSLLVAMAAVESLLVLPGLDPSKLHRPQGSLDLSRMTVHPLVSQTGLEESPSISPDGLWISCLYRLRASDVPRLQIHPAKGGPPVIIDTGGRVVEGRAAWSPDSRELAFAVREGYVDRSLYRASRSGDSLIRIARCRAPSTDSSCEVDWSPDGKTIAVADRQSSRADLYLLNLASGHRRELIRPDTVRVSSPRFSPDGKWVGYVKSISMTSEELYAISTAAGGSPRLVTHSPSNLRGFDWNPDGRSLLAFSSNQSGKVQMWQFPLDRGEPHRLGQLDPSRDSDPSTSRRKVSLAWVSDLSENSLWRMPLVGSDQPAQQLVNSAAADTDADWSSQGRIVFRSNRSGVDELWVAKQDGSEVWQATHFRGPFVGDPHWSPDGNRIAFTARASGNPDIFVINCDSHSATCGEPRQLTQSPASDANPTWSRDGRFLYFTSSRSGDYEIWRMSADQMAEPTRITWNGGYLARESADARWLYYSKLGEGAEFWRMALPARGPGQPETAIVRSAPYRAGATWALGTRELFYYPSVDQSAVPFPAVRALDLDTGQARDLRVGNVRLGRGLCLSPDGRGLLRSQNDRVQTRIMIAE